MNQEIVEAPQGNNVPAIAGDVSLSGSVEAKDIQIPTLFLLQKTSPMIDEDPDLKPGMILDSVEKKEYGSVAQGFMFIPLSFKKDWVIMREGETQWEWHSFEDYNADTANLPWTWEEDGQNFRRDERISFFCLLPDQIDKELESDGDDFDPDDVVLPVRICFKRTSYKAGKSILTFFAKVEEARRRGKDVPYYHSVFNLKAKLDKNKAGQSYQVFEVAKVAKTPDNQKPVCANWTAQMEESHVVIDESLDMEARPAQDVEHVEPVENAASKVGQQF